MKFSEVKQADVPTYDSIMAKVERLAAVASFDREQIAWYAQLFSLIGELRAESAPLEHAEKVLQEWVGESEVMYDVPQDRAESWAGIGLLALRLGDGDFDKLMQDWPNPADFLEQEDRNLTRLKTGFPSLDQNTRGGIPVGIVTAILGAPGVGKTALLSQLGIRAASEGYYVVLLFKDEGRYAGCIRLGQQLGLDRDKLEDRDPETMEQYHQALRDRHILTPDPDDPENGLEKLIPRSFEQANGRIVFLGADSIQSVYSEHEGEARKIIEDRMRLLEGAAKKGAMPFVTSEMNRPGYKNTAASENVRGIASGAESRAIEYVSRLHISLTGDAEKVISAEVGKNSPGGTKWTFFLQFDSVTARLKEISSADAKALAVEQKKTEAREKDSDTWDRIKTALLKHAELNARGLIRETGSDKTRLAEVRDEHVEDGSLLMRPGGNNQQFYRLPDTP